MTSLSPPNGSECIVPGCAARSTCPHHERHPSTDYSPPPVRWPTWLNESTRCWTSRSISWLRPSTELRERGGVVGALPAAAAGMVIGRAAPLGTSSEWSAGTGDCRTAPSAHARPAGSSLAFLCSLRDGVGVSPRHEQYRGRSDCNLCPKRSGEIATKRPARNSPSRPSRGDHRPTAGG